MVALSTRKALEAGQEEAPPSLFLAFFSPTAHLPVPSRQSASQAAYAMPTSLLATILQTPGGYMWHLSTITEPRRCVSWGCQGVFVEHDARIVAVASVVERWTRKTQHVSPLSLLTAAKSFKCQGALLSLDVDITKHGRDKRYTGLNFCRLDITVIIKMVSFLLLLVLSFVKEVAFAGEAKWRGDNKRAYGRAPANVLSA
ncbi:hypothetical protein DPX16_10383 [Anabarilius grahami]|uniref:Uncharacterized protein n=1 Tax=Anabarilius grahami TaxID=495550 RepID=A0A3N0Y570_ANAGA|nr:hypothetical protein DPX16_10383 [Anabarilius grahami]